MPVGVRKRLGLQWLGFRARVHCERREQKEKLGYEESKGLEAGRGLGF